MQPDNQKDRSRLRLESGYRALIGAIAALVMATGTLVLVGWVLGIEALVRLRPDYNPMRFNTALCLVASGGGVWLIAIRASKWRGRLARWLGVLVFATALLTLAEHLFGWDLHIDQLLWHDAFSPSQPGRMVPNRAFLQDRLAQTLSDAIRRKERGALLFIDLDRFKYINDWLGHAAGDIVLKEAAEQLRKCARSTDILARLGGDEFVVVLGGIKDNTDASIAADRIKRGFANEFAVNGTGISIICSIGISIFPADGIDPNSLLKHADIALFSAKEDGRNGWWFFTQEMNGQALRRLSLETAIRLAIEKEQFFLEYQPQVELSTGKIIGAEALLCWRHPEMGLIPPNTFIPIAENIGEITTIGEWVLRTACKQARRWQEEGMPHLTIAVNVSAGQLCQGYLPTVI